MVLRLPDRWVWDFWLADAGTDYHLFFLQAPRSLPHPEMRHRRASVGHAVSADLIDWEILPDALCPGPAGSWDDIATWTGSVIKTDGTWYMFYTGVSSADEGLVQRIGLAVSTDLVVWERGPDGPLIEADPRWYELLDTSVWHDQAWRDPWVFADPDGHGYHALITARSRHGPPDGRGVIAHAVSEDLRTWEVRPPLTSPSGFGQMEVPQVVAVDGRSILVFSTGAEHVANERQRMHPPAPQTGTYLVGGQGPLGPFELSDLARIHPYTDLYSGKLVRTRDGGWVLMGFIHDVDGAFVGEISDPIPFDPATVP
jgi:beta-fructofuranosidase